MSAGSAIACLASVVLLAGCSSFKLGTVAYIPHGQVGTVSVAPPAAAGSAAGSIPKQGTEPAK